VLCIGLSQVNQTAASVLAQTIFLHVCDELFVHISLLFLDF